MITRSIVVMSALAAGALGLAGCASQKEPAEQAVAEIELKLEGSGAQLQKYLPDRYEEINAKVAALRESLAQEKYRSVVADAATVRDELRRAVADSAVRRAQAKVEMEAEWADLVKTLPAMIKAVDAKLAAQRGRPPKGMDRDAYKTMVATYDEARASWSQAAETVDAASFESAVATGRAAKTTITGVMDALGVQAS